MAFSERCCSAQHRAEAVPGTGGWSEAVWARPGAQVPSTDSRLRSCKGTNEREGMSLSDSTGDHGWTEGPSRLTQQQDMDCGAPSPGIPGRLWPK